MSQKQTNAPDPLTQTKESLKIINNALNKSCQSGSFTLDEAYVIKISLLTIEKFFTTVESQTNNTKDSKDSKDFNEQ